MGKILGKVKTFFKPTKKKIAIVGLTAITLALLALCYNIGYKESHTIFDTWWGWDFPEVHYIVEYNPIFYPTSHLIGHAKDEFVAGLRDFYSLWGRRWPPHVDYVISQFTWNIPYYLGVGYVVGCSVVEGTKRIVQHLHLRFKKELKSDRKT